jgi:hypothetical protein
MRKRLRTHVSRRANCALLRKGPRLPCKIVAMLAESPHPSLRIAVPDLRGGVKYLAMRQANDRPGTKLPVQSEVHVLALESYARLLTLEDCL